MLPGTGGAKAEEGRRTGGTCEGLWLGPHGISLSLRAVRGAGGREQGRQLPSPSSLPCSHPGGGGRGAGLLWKVTDVSWGLTAPSSCGSEARPRGEQELGGRQEEREKHKGRAAEVAHPKRGGQAHGLPEAAPLLHARPPRPTLNMLSDAPSVQRGP